MKKIVNVSGIIPNSIVDGPGLRYVLFMQGCHHSCKGCHNPETHAIGTGKDISLEEIYKEILENPLLSGLTISGGEPMLQIDKLIPLIRKVKELGLNVYVYTGYTIEDLVEMNDSVINEALGMIDFLVDGPFIEELKDLTLDYVGSSNQRIINLKEYFNNKKETY